MVVNFPAGPFGEYCGKNFFSTEVMCNDLDSSVSVCEAGSCESYFNGFLIYFLAQDFVIDEALDMDLERYLGDGKM